MHIHQIEVVDYSDNCSCNDCSHIREMTQLEHEFDVIDPQYNSFAEVIDPQDDNFAEVIDYNDTFDEYPVALTKADMKNLLF
jgi:hypothetical protein